MCKHDEPELKEWHRRIQRAGQSGIIAAMNYRESLPACRDVRPFRIPVLFLTFVLQFCTPVLWAAEVQGLYQASVPVASRDDERVRQQAFTTAMRQVIVKLSGRTDALEQPDIRRALGSAQNYVEAWAYRAMPVAVAPGEAGADAPGIALEVVFFESQLQELLDSAGIALWPRNRPDTLLWVVEQDVNGRRSLLAADSPVHARLQALAAERAMPLIVPILDLQDRLALRPDILWELDPAAIQGASSRYGTDSVLVLRIMQLVSGDVIARAEHHLRGLVRELDALEQPLDPFLAGSIDLTARELASNYGVFVSAQQNFDTRVMLAVAGVDSAAAYAAVLRYLENLAVVKDIQPVQVDGGDLLLDVSTGGQLRQLIETLALDRRLQALQEPVRDGQIFRLDYRWQGP